MLLKKKILQLKNRLYKNNKNTKIISIHFNNLFNQIIKLFNNLNSNNNNKRKLIYKKIMIK